MTKGNKEKELAKQVFAQVFGIKRGDWVKKKWHGRKTWVIIFIYNVKGRKIAHCWRNRLDHRYRPAYHARVSEMIPLTNLILIRDNKNSNVGVLDIPRS